MYPTFIGIFLQDTSSNLNSHIYEDACEEKPNCYSIEKILYYIIIIGMKTDVVFDVYEFSVPGIMSRVGDSIAK